MARGPNIDRFVFAPNTFDRELAECQRGRGPRFGAHALSRFPALSLSVCYLSLSVACQCLGLLQKFRAQACALAFGHTGSSALPWVKSA